MSERVTDILERFEAAVIRVVIAADRVERAAERLGSAAMAQDPSEGNDQDGTNA